MTVQQTLNSIAASKLLRAPKKWILAVDDDANDLFWMEEAIMEASKNDFSYHLSMAKNASEARLLLTTLIQECQEGDEIIIFSDVNMPSESGLQLLEWLKDQPQFNDIPVVIVSSFDRRKEIVRAFELGAVACMFKPPEPKAVKGLLNTIKGLWGAKSYLNGYVTPADRSRPAFITSPHSLQPVTAQRMQD